MSSGVLELVPVGVHCLRHWWVLVSVICLEAGIWSVWSVWVAWFMGIMYFLKAMS